MQKSQFKDIRAGMKRLLIGIIVVAVAVTLGIWAYRQINTVLGGGNSAEELHRLKIDREKMERQQQERMEQIERQTREPAGTPE